MEESPLLSDVERLTESLGKLPEPVDKPVFIAVSGLPGTGKSYFAKKLAERIPLVILESDALRKVLFPSPTYSAVESARLFQASHLLIERLLREGISLILDATNLVERHRERLYRIAERLGVKLILVRIEAPPTLVKERLERRAQLRESKSDAGWEVYQKLNTSVEAIKRRHFVVNTSRDITPVINKIVREVSKGD